MKVWTPRGQDIYIILHSCYSLSFLARSPFICVSDTHASHSEGSQTCTDTHTRAHTHRVMWQPNNWQATSLLKTFRDYHVASCYLSTNGRWQGIFPTQNWDETHAHTQTRAHAQVLNILRVHGQYFVRSHSSIPRNLLLSLLVNGGWFLTGTRLKVNLKADCRMQHGDRAAVRWDTTVHAGHFSTHYQHHQSLLPL